MTNGELVKSPGKSRDLQPAAQGCRHHHVVARLGFVEHPQIKKPGRPGSQRQRLFSPLQVGNRRQGGQLLIFQGFGQSCHGGRGEELALGTGQAHLLDAGRGAGGQERVHAVFEEGIVNTKGLIAEQLGKEGQQVLFQRRARSGLFVAATLARRRQGV